MNSRILGRTNLRVSEMAMDCTGIGRSIHRRNDKEAIATLLESLDSGVNLFDTAPNYSAGESERLIGKAFEGKRDKVTISSKVGATGTIGGANVSDRLAPRHVQPIGAHVLLTENCKLDV